MAQMNFDASTVEPAAPLDVLPPGKYEAQIVQSEMRATKAGDGQLLWIEMDILSGQFQGRKLWDQLNLVNHNQQTVEIAQRQLSAICHAVGQIRVDDSEQLHFRPMLVSVKVQPAGPDKHGVHREAQNKIAGYSALGGQGAPPAYQPPRAPAQHGTQPRQAPPPAPPRSGPPAGNVPPWRRT